MPTPIADCRLSIADCSVLTLRFSVFGKLINLITTISFDIALTMPNIKYVAPSLGTGVTLDIPLSSVDLAGLRNASTAAKIIQEKIRPMLYAYLARTPYNCIVCQNQRATRMISNFATHIDSLEGPVIVDYTPYPICESSQCNFEASRRAHEFRRQASRQMPGGLGAAEAEMCDNCQKVQKVHEHGRMKRCSRCKAKLYCSKECQVDHWKKGHKLNCQKA